MRKVLTALSIAVLLAAASSASAWDPTGAKWKLRNGPGIMGGIGSVACGRDTCDDGWGQEYMGSIGVTVGGFYRLMPLLVFFGEINTTYLRLDRAGLSDDGGFLFQLIFGGEFHLPITGWFEAYTGLGIGYAGLRLKGDDGGVDQALKLHGFDVEIRLGGTIYPSSSLPTLGVGPYIKLGIPLWGKACDIDGACTARSDMPDDVKGELPLLFHLGLEVRYGF